MRLWIDDARPAPDGWLLARNYDEAVLRLESGQVAEVSLDYDLDLTETGIMPSGLFVAASNAEAKNGYNVARWIERAVTDGRIPQPIMRCHSTNIIGQELIAAVIQRITKKQ